MHPESYWKGVESRPHAIVADAGSGDIGAQYLGTAAQYASPRWEHHDLRLMLLAARRLRVPMIVGSAGGAGVNDSVDRYAEIVRTIAREEGIGGFRLAKIYSEVDRGFLARRCREVTVPGLGADQPLDPDTVEASSRVVAMMGVEPIIEALDAGADVVIAGRSCDDVLFAAVPIREGKDRGLSLHMGKTIECGPLVATPILPREAVAGTVRGNDFLVEAFHPLQRCTPASVAGHTLYERIDPLKQELPGGYVDLSGVSFEAHTDRVCRVSGSKWVPRDSYEVKLEGAEFVGHRRYVIFGLRDPRSIEHIDAITQAIKNEIEDQVVKLDGEGGITFHVYGKNAVMQGREPTPVVTSHEIAVVVDAVHPDPEIASEMAKIAKYFAFRADYPGKISTAGGAALLADEILAAPNPVYRWTIDHLLRVGDEDLFPMEIDTVP
jgi:hypothetical protein